MSIINLMKIHLKISSLISIECFVIHFKERSVLLSEGLTLSGGVKMPITSLLSWSLIGFLN